MKEISVVAITVTFNSSSFLIRALKNLLLQTRPVDKIIIVDNHSKNEDLKKIEEYIMGKPSIILLKLDQNLGGAGGFQTGMEYAKKNFDPQWYWLMDDDAFPKNDCLEKLLQFGESLENVGCLVPIIWGIDKAKFQLYHHKRENKYLTRDIAVVNDIKNLQSVTQIESSAFVGPLISKISVDTVGIVDGSLFIYGDDLEYIYRISRAYNVYLIRDAIINHRDIIEKGNIVDPKVWWKDYYQYRNRIFFIKKFSKGSKKLIGQTIFSLMLFKRIVFALIQKEYKGYILERIRLICLAWIHGQSNRRGKTIDPVDYIRKIRAK